MGTYIGTYIFLHHKVTYSNPAKKWFFLRNMGI